MSHICWVQPFTTDVISDKKTLKTTREYANRGGPKENRKAVAMERKLNYNSYFANQIYCNLSRLTQCLLSMNFTSYETMLSEEHNNT